MREKLIPLMLGFALGSVGVGEQAESQQFEKRETSPSATKRREGFGKYDFAMTTLQGKEIRLTNYQGNVVLVNIWAPWCVPCRLETPGFVNLYEQYKSKGFEIITANLSPSA